MRTSSRKNMVEVNIETWRESASLIIAAPGHNTNSIYDFNVLVFKRSEQTSYYHDHCVFPGGAFESVDEDNEWLEYFRKFGISPDQMFSLVNNDQNRPKILLNNNSECPKDISLRIAAIRETFEEVGLLLCRDGNNIHNRKGYGHVFNENFDKAHWQRLVHSDAKQFLKLCRYLKVLPDIWSLYEWSVWRSPTLANKKFDTVFYFVALTIQPKLLIEKNEVAEVLWQPPNILLEAYSNRTIWLPSIQFYEISRLTQLFHLRELMEFSKDRNIKGSTQLMPVYFKCKDGITAVLPGDDLYPNNPNDFKETIIVEEFLHQFHSKSLRRHRLVFFDMFNMHVNLNIDPIDNHLSPVKVNTSSRSTL